MRCDNRVLPQTHSVRSIQGYRVTHFSYLAPPPKAFIASLSREQEVVVVPNFSSPALHTHGLVVVEKTKRRDLCAFFFAKKKQKTKQKQRRLLSLF